MSRTHRRTWQRAESRAAGLFGAHRNVLSGSAGRDDRTGSDSTHPTLYVESKLRGRHAVRTLFDLVKAAARREGKTPVLCLADKGRPGFLVCVHSDDLAALARAVLDAIGEGRPVSVGPAPAPGPRPPAPGRRSVGRDGGPGASAGRLRCSPAGPRTGGPKRGRRRSVIHMPLVMRGNNAYFYRCFRHNGRVRCEYVASSATAALIGQAEALERDLREARRCDERAELARLEEIDREKVGRFCLVEALVRLAMESAGFHRHKRGEWRRRRMKPTGVEQTDTPGLPAPAPGAPRKPPAPLDEIRDVLTRASQGDRSALPRLRELLGADPRGMIEVCGGDLAAGVETAAVLRMSGQNLALQYGLTSKLAELRAELAGRAASPVERLLAERVALCWLDCHDWEMRHNQAMERGELTAKQAEHWQRMRDRSHRRYLQALKTLAGVQKMGPAIQINVARNQMNTARG
jgi:hypothetical protein